MNVFHMNVKADILGFSVSAGFSCYGDVYKMYIIEHLNSLPNYSNLCGPYGWATLF